MHKKSRREAWEHRFIHKYPAHTFLIPIKNSISLLTNKLVLETAGKNPIQLKHSHN